jgi:hypothetical protein
MFFLFLFKQQKNRTNEELPFALDKTLNKSWQEMCERNTVRKRKIESAPRIK